VLLATLPQGFGAAACTYVIPNYQPDGAVRGFEYVERRCTLVVSKPGYHDATVAGVSPQGGGCSAGTPQKVRIVLQPN
jgi:hypothetical protein